MTDRAEAPDTLTPKLKIDDTVLKGIITSLYYPDSPYEFSVFPADILGQVYEQFLGKVIRLTKSHQAKVEDKPEVKKAGGVYYTPTYIVEYIVKQTVGKLLEGKTPKDVEKLRVLDPACGSGSFLIGAYQYLLDWHLQWYLTPPNPPAKRRGKEAPPIYQDARGQWRLTLRERKRILLSNIYGVDIDPQAVEVTKLSLLLKVLEGETSDTIGIQLRLGFRALPDLSENIKCGNSLIGPDFYTDHPDLSEDERQRINPFDWHDDRLGFGTIMKAGGFDAVIGNPPYGAVFTTEQDAFVTNRYETATGYKDIYAYFLERGLALLGNGGLLSYIVPSAWLGGPLFVPLRRMILAKRVTHILMLPFDVFKDAYIDTVVIVIGADASDEAHKTMTYEYGKKERIAHVEIDDCEYRRVNQNDWLSSEDLRIVLDPDTVSLVARLREHYSRCFGDVIRIKRGVLFDKKYLTSRKTSANSHRYFEGDVYRYDMNTVCNKWIEFGDKMAERPKEIEWFVNKRILLRRLANRQHRLMSSLASESFITNKNLYSILGRSPDDEIRFFLGLINSRLISYLYMKLVTQAVKDDFPQITIADIKRLPYPNLSDKADKARHDKLVRLVEKMLKLHKDVKSATLPSDEERIKREIAATDREIDKLVYELYGLTEEEIQIVEGAAA